LAFGQRTPQAADYTIAAWRRHRRWAKSACHRLGLGAVCRSDRWRRPLGVAGGRCAWL